MAVERDAYTNVQGEKQEGKKVRESGMKARTSKHQQTGVLKSFLPSNPLLSVFLKVLTT